MPPIALPGERAGGLIRRIPVKADHYRENRDEKVRLLRFLVCRCSQYL